MMRLRRSIIFLLIFLSIVYNVERLDSQGENIVDLQSFFYFLITSAVVLTLLFRKLRRWPVYYSLLLWTAVYLILKLLVFNYRPALGGIYTYLSITELALLSISVLLAYDLASAVHELEDVIEKVTFPKQGMRIHKLADANEEIITELTRSRRHDRPLSVLVVELESKNAHFTLERVIKNIQQSMVDRYLMASLAKILNKEARRTDMIFEEEEGVGFVLLLPETSTEGSSILSKRIQDVAMERLGLAVRCGCAAFPKDELTFDDLLRKARQYAQAAETLRSLAQPPAEPEPVETTADSL